jgi:hypothetical protein
VKWGKYSNRKFREKVIYARSGTFMLELFLVSGKLVLAGTKKPAGAGVKFLDKGFFPSDLLRCSMLLA